MGLLLPTRRGCCYWRLVQEMVTQPGQCSVLPRPSGFTALATPLGTRGRWAKAAGEPTDPCGSKAFKHGCSVHAYCAVRSSALLRHVHRSVQTVARCDLLFPAAEEAGRWGILGRVVHVLPNAGLRAKSSSG